MISDQDDCKLRINQSESETLVLKWMKVYSTTALRYVRRPSMLDPRSLLLFKHNGLAKGELSKYPEVFPLVLMKHRGAVFVGKAVVALQRTPNALVSAVVNAAISNARFLNFDFQISSVSVLRPLEKWQVILSSAAGFLFGKNYLYQST